ncbi:hypothetical protein Tco_0879573 [Tanacetum coccineum]
MMLSSHKRTYITPTLTQKLFSNMRRVTKGYSREETPLFPTMLAIDQPGQDTRVQSPITEPHTSPSQITQPPTSSTIRETIKQEVEIPQSNFPTQTPVADEAAFIGVNVVHGGVATTVSSIDARQGDGNISKSSIMPHDSPLLGEVTTVDAELNTASTFVSTASPQRHTDTTTKTLMEIRKSAAKTKGKAIMKESE